MAKHWEVDYHGKTSLLFVCFLVCSDAFPSRTYDEIYRSNKLVSLPKDPKTCPSATGTESSTFQNMIINGSFVYVGATNVILQFSTSTLTKFINKHTTGPFNDSELCTGAPFCGPDLCRGAALSCNSNYNTMLLPYNKFLLSCGTLYQLCDLLFLSNISVTNNSFSLKCKNENNQFIKISPASVTEPVVAAVYNNYKNRNRDIFYLGKSPDSTSILFPPDNTYPFFSKFGNSPPDTDNAGNALLVTYKLAWTTESYGYTLWSSKDATSNLTLSRICNEEVLETSRQDVVDEPNYPGKVRASYTETILACNGIEVTNSHVVAVYIYEKLYIMFRNGQNSLLCSASVSAVDLHINTIRKKCWNSSQGINYALPIQGIKGGCTNLSDAYTREWATCSLPSTYKSFLNPIKAIQPLQMALELSLPISATGEVTSFTIGTENSFFVALIGTAQGIVIKAPLSGVNTISEAITLLPEPVLSSMAIDPTNQHLFAITRRAVYKVKVADCENQYKTCRSCIESRDPYCGWCVLQSRCTRKSSCTISSQVINWIGQTYNSTFCPRISSILPEALLLGRSQKVNLTIIGTSLDTSLQYNCTFTTQEDVVAASISSLENYPLAPSCSVNLISHDIIPKDSDHANITLSIVYKTSVVAIGTFRVYECSKIAELNTYSMCSSCVDSGWGCVWCQNTFSCQTSGSCPGNAITMKQKCPVLAEIYNFTEPIPVGRKRIFFLKTLRLPVSPGDPYLCRYNFCDGKLNTSNAIINESSQVAQCVASADLLSCNKNSTEIKISLQLGNYVIDSLGGKNVKGVLFNCNVGTDNCGRCIEFRKYFGECAWCGTGSVCRPKSDCTLGGVDHIAQCPAASITSVSPLNGPVSGSTEVTIDGVNLGSNVTQISNVLVGQVKCDVIQKYYVASVRIVCTTSRAINESMSGPVSVMTSYSNATIKSSQIFQYKKVDSTHFDPKTVLSGSTIKISGLNLNVGNSAKLSLTPNVTVLCTDRIEKSVSCKLPETLASPLTKEISYDLSLMLDGYVKQFSTKLTIAPIPEVVRVTSPTPISAYRTAGGKVSLLLSSLDGVQSADIQAGDQRRDCTIQQNSSSLECVIPPFKQRSKRQADTSLAKDNSANTELKLVLNGIHGRDLGSVTYVPDPIISDISSLPCESKRSSGGDTGYENGTLEQESNYQLFSIEIPGKNFLKTNAKVTDYTVTLIPTGPPVSCNVFYIQPDSLFCHARSSELNKFTNQELDINVTIGELTRVQRVLYCTGPDLIWVAITIPVVALLVAIIVALLIRHRRRVRKQAREKKMILMKLDDLENKTREAGRNAYFELQVGYMNNLADNLTHRITYLPAELYFTQTLFQMQRGHVVLNKKALQNESTRRIEAIEDWLRLLKNKDFLCIFVRTLENQKHFTVQEKGNVASLLTVCLLQDMPYFTSIMFTLLSELIQRHVQRNPKLLLRRSESVVEKIVSHWLSITLYDECIMDKSGKPIFLLTKAIHYLVGSAPCDVIANKAFNSLNEMTLLGFEIAYETLVLHASIEEESGKTTEPVDVNVVNVDSISQVKEKIIDAVYKDKPFSECPKPDDLVLEFHSGADNKEGIILSDVDNLAATEGNYTKINTLKRYNVPDKAYVVLRPGSHNPVSQDSKEPLLRNKTRHLYHLINPREDDNANGYMDIEDGTKGKKANALLEDMINRPFQEIYLTRMVRSKTTLQEYVDGVFKSILCPEPIPLAVRYFFQFLDEQAARHKINDSEVIHIWKTNSLLLRYWVNVLKNPEFLFDIQKGPIVDSCLNVITQAFMDACTTTSRKLGHDSPSNKLLYAKDAEQYKIMVHEFFRNTANTPRLEEVDINNMLIKHSQQHTDKFNEQVAAQQLFSYVLKYTSQMLEALHDEGQENIVSIVEDLVEKLSENSSSTTAV